MLPETLQLEQLRQQIEAAEYQIGSQSDYLSYGKPNPQQARRSQDFMARTKVQSEAMQATLEQLIAKLRTEKPEAIEEWINLHKGMLTKIIAEKVTNINSRARQNVARDTLQAWDRVLAGDQSYVNINWHFLKDYKAELKNFGVTTTSQQPDVKSDGKKANPWWRIW